MSFHRFRASSWAFSSASWASGAFHSLDGLLISPIWAGAAMSLSSLSVVGNALRLRRVRL